MKKKLLVFSIIVLALLLVTVPVSVSADDSVTVPGTACVHFAGQTQSGLEAAFPPSAGWINVQWGVGGGGNHNNFHNDTADWVGVLRAQQQPRYFTDRTGTAIVPSFIGFCGGGTLSVSASGEWGHGPAHPSGPGGKGVTVAIDGEYDDLGISLVSANLNTLIGVFLTDDLPNPGATPASLTSPTTSPALQQAFAIGASLANITIPAGATRLFFGLQDGYEWWNNGGSVVVNVVTMTCPVIEVDIDIKPGSDPNCINLGSQGVIPVAILSTADFDATQVDPTTVELAGAGVAVRGKAKKPLAHEEDVNGDGLVDLVLQVETEDLDPGEFQDGTACLTGETYETYGGQPVEGCDEICLVPPE